MICRSLILAPLVALLLSCSSTLPHKPFTDPIGTVVETNGIPTLTRRARPYMLGKESKVFRGDILRTDVASSLSIELITGTRFFLSPRSELHIETFSRSGEQWLLSFTLASGAMEIQSRVTNEQFTLRTNIARLDTRNPNLWVGYSAGYRRLDVVALGTEEIRVNNPDGTTVLNQPLEASAITPGAAPQAKTIWSDTKMNTTRQTFNRLQAQN